MPVLFVDSVRRQIFDGHRVDYVVVKYTAHHCDSSADGAEVEVWEVVDECSLDFVDRDGGDNRFKEASLERCEEEVSGEDGDEQIRVNDSTGCRHAL